MSTGPTAERSFDTTNPERKLAALASRGSRPVGCSALLGTLLAAYALGGAAVALGDTVPADESSRSLTERLRQAPPEREHPEIRSVSRSGTLQTFVPNEHLDALLNKYSLRGCHDQGDQPSQQQLGGGPSAPRRCLYDAQDSYDRQAQRHYLSGPDGQLFGIGQHPSTGATPGGATEGLTDRVALRLAQLLAAPQSPWLQSLLGGRISFDIPLGKAPARASESPPLRPTYRVVYESPTKLGSPRGKRSFAMNDAVQDSPSSAPSGTPAEQALMARQWAAERRQSETWGPGPLSPTGADYDPGSPPTPVTKRLVEVFPETSDVASNNGSIDGATDGTSSSVGDYENQGFRYRLSRTLGLGRPVFDGLSATFDRGSGAPRPEDIRLTVAEASASIVFVELHPLRLGEQVPAAQAAATQPVTTGVTIPYRAHRAVIRTYFDQRPTSITWEHRVQAATMGCEFIPATESLKLQAQFDL